LLDESVLDKTVLDESPLATSCDFVAAGAGSLPNRINEKWPSGGSGRCSTTRMVRVPATQSV